MSSRNLADTRLATDEAQQAIGTVFCVNELAMQVVVASHHQELFSFKDRSCNLQALIDGSHHFKRG